MMKLVWIAAIRPSGVVRELAFHVMVERGLAESDAKCTVSNEEMGRRIRSGQK